MQWKPAIEGKPCISITSITYQTNLQTHQKQKSLQKIK